MLKVLLDLMDKQVHKVFKVLLVPKVLLELKEQLEHKESKELLVHKEHKVFKV